MSAIPIRFSRLLGLPILLLVVSIVTVQGQCDVRALEVLKSVERICVNNFRDGVCYGNIQVRAIPHTGIDSLRFEQPGDLTSVALVRSLQLSPLSTTNGTWGIAQMRLTPLNGSANGQDMTLLFFGDVTVEDRQAPRTALEMRHTAAYNLNVRQFPSTESTVLGTVGSGETMRIIGRLEDSSWLRIQKAEPALVGWISADQLMGLDTAQLSRITIENQRDPYYGPMRAISFRSGSNAAANCGSVAPNGLLVQTPAGVARVSMLINEVAINFVSNGAGATAFIESGSSESMQINMLAGGAVVEAGGSSSFVPPGSQLVVPMDESMQPAGPPMLGSGSAGIGAFSAFYAALDYEPVFIPWVTPIPTVGDAAGGEGSGGSEPASGGGSTAVGVTVPAGNGTVPGGALPPGNNSTVPGVALPPADSGTIPGVVLPPADSGNLPGTLPPVGGGDGNGGGNGNNGNGNGGGHGGGHGNGNNGNGNGNGGGNGNGNNGNGNGNGGSNNKPLMTNDK